MKFKKIRSILLSLSFVALVYLFFTKYIPGTATTDRPISTASVMYDKNMVKYIPYEVISHTYDNVIPQQQRERDNMSRFAYVQYATDWNYLCSCIINFVALDKLGSKADFVLLITDILESKIDDKSKEGQRFWENVKEHGVKVKTVDAIQIKSESSTWDQSFTKFQVFKLEEFERIIYFDSDARINDKMDELFFLPDCLIAMPAAYELNYELFEDKNYPLPEDYEFLSLKKKVIKDRSIFANVPTENLADYNAQIYNRLPDMPFTKGFKFENQIMVIKPSVAEFNKLMRLAKKKQAGEYDMDIINKLYDVDVIANKPVRAIEESLNVIPEILIIPHLQYGFLTGELRYQNHDIVLADPQDLPYAISDKLPHGFKNYWAREFWDAQFVFMRKVKLAHFSDYPIPKPWYKQTIPNSYVSAKILCENDVDRMEEYNDYNAEHPDLEEPLMPTLVTDCEAANIWNRLYEFYLQQRREICALRPYVRNEGTRPIH